MGIYRNHFPDSQGCPLCLVHKSTDSLQQSAQLSKLKHGSLEIHIVCRAGALERSPREGFDRSLLPPIMNDKQKHSQTCQQNPEASTFFRQDLQSEVPSIPERFPRFPSLSSSSASSSTKRRTASETLVFFLGESGTAGRGSSSSSSFSSSFSSS